METLSDRITDELICAENDKENDSRSGPASQAMIQRRRRPKRRSTGVVHVDMEVKLKMSDISRDFSSMNRILLLNQDIDPDHQESPADNGNDKDVVSSLNVLKIATTKLPRLP